MFQKKDYAMLQYGNLKKEEIKEASELAARSPARRQDYGAVHQQPGEP